MVEISPMAGKTRVQSQVETYQSLKKIVLDVALLNTQYFKVRFTGKVELFIERSLPYTSV